MEVKADKSNNNNKNSNDKNKPSQCGKSYILHIVVIYFGYYWLLF